MYQFRLRAVSFMHPTVHDVGRAYSNAPDSWGVRIGNKKTTKMADTITKSAWQSIFNLLQKYGDLQEKYYRNVFTLTTS